MFVGTCSCHRTDISAPRVETSFARTAGLSGATESREQYRRHQRRGSGESEVSRFRRNAICFGVRTRAAAEPAIRGLDARGRRFDLRARARQRLGLRRRGRHSTAFREIQRAV